MSGVVTALQPATLSRILAPPKREPVPQVQQQWERIGALPQPKQCAVMDVIEDLLAQQGR